MDRHGIRPFRPSDMSPRVGRVSYRSDGLSSVKRSQSSDTVFLDDFVHAPTTGIAYDAASPLIDEYSQRNFGASFVNPDVQVGQLTRSLSQTLPTEPYGSAGSSCSPVSSRPLSPIGFSVTSPTRGRGESKWFSAAAQHAAGDCATPPSQTGHCNGVRKYSTTSSLGEAPYRAQYYGQNDAQPSQERRPLEQTDDGEPKATRPSTLFIDEIPAYAPSYIVKNAVKNNNNNTSANTNKPQMNNLSNNYSRHQGKIPSNNVGSVYKVNQFNSPTNKLNASPGKITNNNNNNNNNFRVNRPTMRVEPSSNQPGDSQFVRRSLTRKVTVKSDWLKAKEADEAAAMVKNSTSPRVHLNRGFGASLTGQHNCLGALNGRSRPIEGNVSKIVANNSKEQHGVKGQFGIALKKDIVDSRVHDREKDKNSSTHQNNSDKGQTTKTSKGGDLQSRIRQLVSASHRDSTTGQSKYKEPIVIPTEPTDSSTQQSLASTGETVTTSSSEIRPTEDSSDAETVMSLNTTNKLSSKVSVAPNVPQSSFSPQTQPAKSPANRYVPHARYAATKHQQITTPRVADNELGICQDKTEAAPINNGSVNSSSSKIAYEGIGKSAISSQSLISDNLQNVGVTSKAEIEPEMSTTAPPPPPALPDPNVSYRPKNNNCALPMHSSPVHKTNNVSKVGGTQLEDRVALMQEVRGHTFINKSPKNELFSKNVNSAATHNRGSNSNNFHQRKVFTKSSSTDNIFTSKDKFLGSPTTKLGVDINNNKDDGNGSVNNRFRLPTLNHVKSPTTTPGKDITNQNKTEDDQLVTIMLSESEVRRLNKETIEIKTSLMKLKRIVQQENKNEDDAIAALKKENEAFRKQIIYHKNEIDKLKNAKKRSYRNVSMQTESLLGFPQNESTIQNENMTQAISKQLTPKTQKSNYPVNRFTGSFNS